MERKALGRGLSALITEKETEKSEKIILAPLDKIRPSPFQPREDFNNENLEELTQSIREKGLLQPLLVRRQGDGYELIAGERRYRAAKLLNLQEIPIIIKDVDDKDSLEISLIENIQRQELNPIEEARAYLYLIEKFHVTQEQLAEILGKARASVTNALRLLRLPQEIQEEIKKGRLSFAHGKVLLEIEDVNAQRRLAHNIISKNLSVRELECLMKTLRPRLSRRRLSSADREPQVLVLEEELQQLLATKVKIQKRKKRGQIIIEFYSQEDLERITQIFREGKRV